MQKVIKAIKDCVASKTCCEETGVDCNQGRNCPVREGTHKPAEAVHQIHEPTVNQQLTIERDAFEAKYKHLDLSRDRDAWMQEKYKHAAVSLAWESWQARAALAATPAAAPVVLPESLAKAIDRFDAYFRSANGVPPNARISVPTSEWQELRALLATGGQAQAPMQCVECNSCGSAFDVDSYMAGYTDGKGHCLNCPGVDHSAPQQADARDADDADLIEWLSGQYLAADFQWGEPKTPVLVIEIPATASVCGDFRTDVRAAIAIAAAKEQGQ